MNLTPYCQKCGHHADQVTIKDMSQTTQDTAFSVEVQCHNQLGRFPISQNYTATMTSTDALRTIQREWDELTGATDDQT